jgi:hypothetical protein
MRTLNSTLSRRIYPKRAASGKKTAIDDVLPLRSGGRCRRRKGAAGTLVCAKQTRLWGAKVGPKLGPICVHANPSWLH